MTLRRTAALLLPVILLAGLLTACVRNLPNAAVDWLADRDGIAEAQVLTDATGAWSSGGLVRGELEPGLGDDEILRLTGEIEQYASTNGGVAFWLGYERLDFSVSADVPTALAAWRTVSDVTGVVSGIVFSDELRLRALRDDAVAAYEALSSLEQTLRIEAFTGTTLLRADEIADLDFDQHNPLAVEYIRSGCEPAAEVLTFVEGLLTRETVSGATAELCAGVTVDVPAAGSVATEATELRAQLDELGLAEFPVQLTSEVDGPGVVHFAAVTPGAASRLDVLEVFERDGAPTVSYSLGPDGALAVTAYDVPTADLLTLMQEAPAASALAGIGLEGDPVAIVAPLDHLPGLLDEALALEDASTHFGSVQLGTGFGIVTLQAAENVATPDIAAAVADLRASGVTDRRFFSVRWAAFQADIANGTAALTDPEYVGADVLQAFVDAWNLGG